MSITHRVRRTLGVAMAGAMVLSLLPAGAAFADFDDVCEGAPDNDFDDADNISETQEPFVDCMAAYGITVGDNDGDFNPGESTSRQHMALFLARTLSQAEDGDLTIPEDEDDEFSDISDINPEEARHAINWLEERGLIEGYEDGTYRPAVDVRRDQMASFIVRLMVELGVTMPVVTEDHFEDDDGTFHEDNINILAELGIVQGFPDGTYRPGADVTRQQMAAYIIGAVIEIDEAGNWNGEFVEQPGTPNQTYSVSPQEAATNVSGEDRQYSLSGLDDDESYRIVLFDADNVSTDENGVVTFTDAENSGAGNDQADTGTVDADITVVNGSSTTGGPDEVEASPVGGTIAFTVESNATSVEEIVPVVYLDEDSDNNLDLDSSNRPTEDFGIGGEKRWVPTEAGSGTITGPDTIDYVDTGADFFVADGATYFYDSNDVLQVADEGTTNCVQVTMAEFEERLSVDDELLGQSYNRNADFPSTLCVQDEAPSAPTAIAADAEDHDTVEVEWTASTLGDPDTYNVYRRQTSTCPGTLGTGDLSNYTLAGSVDGDETEFTDEGLTATTDYCYTVTAVSGDDESSPGNPDAATTLAVGDTTRPTIDEANLTTDAGLQGIADGGDIWTLEFSENMDTTSMLTSVYVVQDDDGDRATVDCNTTDATCTFLDNDGLATGDGTDTFRITLNIPLVDGTDQLDYSLTIVTTNADVQDPDGNVVDLSESDDRTIG